MEKAHATTMNRELNRIKAVQHKYYLSEYGTTSLSSPLDFRDWFLEVVKIHVKRGYRFEGHKETRSYTIVTPNGTSFERTVADFKDEWENEYCAQFSPLTHIPFEENAGVNIA